VRYLSGTREQLKNHSFHKRETSGKQNGLEGKMVHNPEPAPQTVPLAPNSIFTINALLSAQNILTHSLLRQKNYTAREMSVSVGYYSKGNPLFCCSKKNTIDSSILENSSLLFYSTV